MQCRCDRAQPNACVGQTLPAAVAKRSAVACAALEKITAGMSARKLRRFVSAVGRSTRKAVKSTQKAMSKQQLTTDCGSALVTRLDEIKTGAAGLLTP